MNQKLIRTDTLGYKIKNFFRQLFGRKKESNNDNFISSNELEKNVLSDLSFRKELEEENRKIKLAKDLIEKKITIDDLSDNQVQEMIEYFEKYIEDRNTKLLEIKNNILQIKKSNA